MSNMNGASSLSSRSKDDVVDVESRVVSTELVDDSSATASEATQVQPVVQEGAGDGAAKDGEASVPKLALVPALVAKAEIEKANPALLQLAALKKEIADAKVEEIDIATKEGEERVRTLLRRCVKLRTSTEGAYNAWNRPLLDAQKGVREIVKKVEAGITPEETALKAIVDKIEAEREAEKQRKIEAEQKRIADIRERIAAIQRSLVDAVTMKSAQIDTRVGELQDMLLTDAEFGEFADEAALLRNEIIGQLMGMSRSKREQEDLSARLEAERQERLAREREAEIERGLRAKISELQTLAFSAMGKTASQIKQVLNTVVAKEPLALEFGALFQEANSTWLMAKAALENAHAMQARAEEAAAERRRQEAAAAVAAAPAPAPAASAPAPAETPSVEPKVEPEDPFSDDPFSLPVARSDAALDKAISAAPQESIKDLAADLSELADGGEPQLSMSMFASREDYHTAVAVKVVVDAWGDEHGEPGVIAADILETLAMGDFPTEHASELDLVSLLLHPEVLEALRARRTALINAIPAEATAA